jgi:cytochrome c nitrite reductase small subunit
VILAASQAASELTVPLPHGWIGTTSQWIEGFGLGLVVLDLILLVLVWYWLRGRDAMPRMWGWVLVAVGLVPLLVGFMTFAHGLESSATVSACGSCHVMAPFVRDLQDPKSDTLAATHYKNRFILRNQCYECHSDYGLAGTITAKLAGVGHVWHYTTGSYTLPIKISKPFPNSGCLECHGESQRFLNSPSKKEILPDLMSGKMSCLDCHGPAHPEQKKEAHL